MPSANCLNFSVLIRYAKDGYKTQERAKLTEHLSSCKHCSDELVLIKKILNTMPESAPPKTAENPDLPQAFLALEEKLYLQGLQGKERQDLFRFLASSNACFTDFSRTKENSSTDISKAEEDFLSELASIKVPDRLSAYEDAFFRQNPGTKTGPQNRPAFFTTLSNLLALLVNHRIAVAVTLLFIIATSGWWYSSHRHDRILEMARDGHSKLLASQNVSAGILRPVGALVFSPIGQMRSTVNNGKFEQRYASIFDALAQKPENAELNRYAGSVYLHHGQFEQAETHFEKAIAANPSYAAAYNDLARLAIERERYDGAIRHLHRAIEIEPELQEAHYNLAIVYTKAGQINNALNTWRTYVTEIDPAQQSDWHQVAKAEIRKLERRL